MSDTDSQRLYSSVRLAPRPHKLRLPSHRQLSSASYLPNTVQRCRCACACNTIQSSPYFDPTYTRTGWIGQPPILNRHEVVTIDGDVDTLGQATP